MSIINRNNWDQFPRGPKAYEFFEDFMTQEAASATAGTSGILFTAISSGTITVLDSVHGGVIRIEAATTDNRGAGLQSDTEFAALRANTETRYLARVRLGNTGSTGDTVVQSDLHAGLIIKDTDIIGGVSDGIYFRKTDGAATLECIVERDSAETTSGAVFTMVESTWYDLAICVEMGGTAGGGTARFFVNGNQVAAVTSTAMPYESEEYLAPAVEWQSGDASGTRYCDVDYVGATGER